FDLELPPCVAVTAIGESMNYVADPRAGGARVGGGFARAHRGRGRAGARPVRRVVRARAPGAAAGWAAAVRPRRARPGARPGSGAPVVGGSRLAGLRGAGGEGGAHAARGARPG